MSVSADYQWLTHQTLPVFVLKRAPKEAYAEALLVLGYRVATGMPVLFGAGREPHRDQVRLLQSLPAEVLIAWAAKRGLTVEPLPDIV